MDRHLLGCVMLVSGSKAVGWCIGSSQISTTVYLSISSECLHFGIGELNLEGFHSFLEKVIHSVVIFRRGRLMPACRSQYIPDMPVAPAFFPPGGSSSG